MRVALILTVSVALYATSAVAQTAMPACNGDIATVRISHIKPGGSMQKFMDAVAAHLAWYRANGFKDNELVTSLIIVKDEKTGAMKYSDTDVISYHLRPPAREKIKNRGNAAWSAYVKLYAETSEITNEYSTCMPMLAR